MQIVGLITPISCSIARYNDEKKIFLPLFLYADCGLIETLRLYKSILTPSILAHHLFYC